ncbi:MAG TPA: TIGR03620 family F420-dependent LLM class oxidoreductase [Streptosporangiaceae bacterium]|jgi:probable F420-dependent oxidoreductase
MYLNQPAGVQAGRLGLGAVGLALNVADGYLDEAAEAERLGFSAIWLPGGQLDRLSRLTDVLGATTTIPVAPAIIPLDVYQAADIAAVYARAEDTAPGRLLIGIGGPQQPRPLRALNACLDDLDHAGPPVPAGRRLLAALGPRKLDLARDRAAGALPLLVTPAWVRSARARLGPDRALVIGQMVVLDSDTERARATARRPLTFLSGVHGYREHFARMEFSESEITGLSDRLTDALVARGDAGAIAARVAALLSAGADHVSLQVLSQDGQPGPARVARELAGLLPGLAA